MRFVTTYEKGTDEIASVSLRTKFRSRGLTLEYRAYDDRRHYSLNTPSFLLEHLKKGKPVTWLDVRTRFNGYPDTIPLPNNFDVIASQDPQSPTLHPTNFRLHPLILFPSEQTLLFLKYWIAACDDARSDQTWEDALSCLLHGRELERIGIDLLLLPDNYISKFYSRNESSLVSPTLDDLRDQLPLAITPYDISRPSSKASLNLQQMNAETLGFNLVGVPKNKAGSSRGACLLSAYLSEMEKPVYIMPEGASLRRVPWFLFTTHADLVLVGKPNEKLTLTHAFARNTYDAKLLLDQAEKAPEGMTNQEFVDLHAYTLVKIVDIPNSLHDEVFCEVGK